MRADPWDHLELGDNFVVAGFGDCGEIVAIHVDDVWLRRWIDTVPAGDGITMRFDLRQFGGRSLLQ